ncbi:hypothetical protein JOB18_047329 [Solea senegalensis]|uniref:Uncharacterized protein n=1 Tax=Solea senegalensis TaxID=28829 RepID=A0AAV6S626_SOLSE|nr:hypothetical protein JOB18_047329 [Solea senegalensis]
MTSFLYYGHSSLHKSAHEWTGPVMSSRLHRTGDIGSILLRSLCSNFSMLLVFASLKDIKQNESQQHREHPAFLSPEFVLLLEISCVSVRQMEIRWHNTFHTFYTFWWLNSGPKRTPLLRLWSSLLALLRGDADVAGQPWVRTTPREVYLHEGSHARLFSL